MSNSLQEAVVALGKDAGATSEQLEVLLASAAQVEEEVKQYEGFVAQITVGLAEEMKRTAPAFDTLRQEATGQHDQLELAIQRASERLNLLVEGLRKIQPQVAQDSKGLESALGVLKQQVGQIPRLYEDALNTHQDAAQKAVGNLKAAQQALQKGAGTAGIHLLEASNASTQALIGTEQQVALLGQRLTALQPAFNGQLADFASRSSREVGALDERFKQLVAHHLTAPVREAKEEARQRIQQEIEGKTTQLVDTVVNDGLKKVVAGIGETSGDSGHILEGLKNIPDEMGECGRKLKWLADNMSEILRLLGKSLTQAIARKGKQFVGWLEEKTGLNLSALKEVIEGGADIANLGIDIGVDILRLSTTAMLNPGALAKELTQTMSHLKEGVKTMKNLAKKATEGLKDGAKKVVSIVKSLF